MPHMAPISWTLILIFSLSMILIMVSMVYFNVNITSPSKATQSVEVSNVNWKW